MRRLFAAGARDWFHAEVRRAAEAKLNAEADARRAEAEAEARRIAELKAKAAAEAEGATAIATIIDARPADGLIALAEEHSAHAIVVGGPERPAEARRHHRRHDDERRDGDAAQPLRCSHFPQPCQDGS